MMNQILLGKSGRIGSRITDGTAEYNNKNYRLSLFYDLAKCLSFAWLGHYRSLLQRYHCTAVALTPGWMRSL
jgi:hypothetical protein